MPLVGSALLKEMNFTLNKREFSDAFKLRYGWEFNDIPTVCICEDFFDADHVLCRWYRPHCVRSVLATSVKILPYRPPARLIRTKYYFKKLK